MMWNKKGLKPWGSVGVGILLLSSPSVYADITGKVFRDFNANGAFDTSASFNEVGMAGITVKAFGVNDATNAPTATALSGADGAYTLTGLSAGTNYRLEFSWAENWLKPGAAGGTSIQFVKGDAGNVHFGLNAPDDFSQDNPQIIVSNFAVGEPTAPEVAGKPRLMEFGYTSGGEGRNFTDSMLADAAPGAAGTGNAMPTAGATHSRIDSVLMGQVGPLFGLAFHRESNTVLAATFMKRFVGFPGGASDTKLGTIYSVDRKTNPNAVTSFFTANAGVDSHDYSRADLSAPLGDTAAAARVGKAGWGDIDLASDGKTLYAINLFDKNIYAIPVNSSATGIISAGMPTIIPFPSTITNGLCADNDWVPGGVKVAHDSVYVTVTCTAETSQLASNLSHYVYKFALNSPANFSQIVSISNYTRSGDYVYSQWIPWVDDADVKAAGSRSYDQPWLMDIEFDDTGRLFLGVKNRTADMLPSNNGNFFFAFGDTLVGLPKGDGTYTMTVNEFVDDDSGHAENDMGMLAGLPGSGVMMTPAHIGDLRQGIRTYLTTAASSATASGTISPLRYYAINQAPRTVTAIGDPFGKVAGLGDIEVLAQPAPIEVGNRVWRDTDADGIQDADEAGIDGVDVVLTCGAETATVTTADGGIFIFSNATGGNAAFMDYGESCSISVDGTQASLKDYTLTSQNADGITDNNAQTDLRDSDATDNAGTAEIAFTVGNAGENNHTLDIGYKSAPVVAVDISLIKVADKTEAKRGDTVVYTLTASNAGPDTATDVAVTDKLPAGVTWVSDDSSGTYDKTTGVWTLGELLKEDSKVLHITVTVN